MILNTKNHNLENINAMGGNNAINIENSNLIFPSITDRIKLVEKHYLKSKNNCVIKIKIILKMNQKLKNFCNMINQ